MSQRGPEVGGAGGAHPLKSLRRQIDNENMVYEENFQLYNDLNIDM